MTGENDPGFGKTVAAQTPGKRAEEKVATDTKSFPDMSVSEMPGLIHELRVHQVELEMQNEELRKNQAETERSCKAYQDLWELSPVGCLIVDIDGRVTAVNRAGQRLFGKSKNAFLKERFSMLVTPENEMSVNLMCERALETGIGEKQEIRILKPDGAIHICLLEVSSLGSEPGREQIQAVLTDITKLKQAEQTLRENEEKYRQLFENESDAVMIFDAETGQFEDANQATIDLYGYSKDEFLTLKVEDISAEKEMTRSNVKRIRDGGVLPKQVPLRYFKKKDATVFPGEISTGKFIIEGREKIIGAVRDITERICAEEALQESEERYRHLVDSARDIIYTVSSDTTILSMNPAIENMTGWSPSECIDKHLASFVHPDDFSLAMEMGQRALQGDKPPIHEVRILSKSGKYVIGEFSIAPFI